MGTRTAETSHGRIAVVSGGRGPSAAATRTTARTARTAINGAARIPQSRIPGYARRMELAASFEDAQSRVKQLSKSPSTDDLLELYAFYKQATNGDVSGSRPACST